MNDLDKMCTTLEEYSVAELGKGKEKANTKELGEVFDMMKDASEIKKNKAEECYYYALIDAMENADYGEDYDYRGRMGYQGNMDRPGNSMRQVRNMRGYEPNMGYDDNSRMMDMRNGRMGYGNNRGNQSMRSNSNSSGSRYGYSHDEYMEAKQMYSPNDPEGKRKRMETLNDYIEDLTDSAKELVAGMTPEEKQHWKSKITNLINM